MSFGLVLPSAAWAIGDALPGSARRIEVSHGPQDSDRLKCDALGLLGYGLLESAQGSAVLMDGQHTTIKSGEGGGGSPAPEARHHSTGRRPWPVTALVGGGTHLHGQVLLMATFAVGF